MTRERYLELLSAGPEITAEDYERLKNFIPKQTAMAQAVEAAMAEIEVLAKLESGELTLTGGDR